jgi:hypothetical protein
MAKAKAKVVNYSDADLSILKAGYTGSDNAAEVSALASKLNKTPASIRAKLASLKIYVKAEKADEASERVTKSAIVEDIAKVVDLSEAEIEGLTKATKSALEKVLANLA